MGIFTKKDTNTISGDNKYKGWGNTKTKVFEDERQKAAVMGAVGGDLKGKDFRQYKRDVHQQKRLNRRALRRADRQGIDPSKVEMRKGEYKELNRREQDIEQYFKDVRKERLENTGEIAAVVAGTVLTAGALGAFAPATAVSGGATATGTAVGGGVGTGISGGATGSGIAGVAAGPGAALTPAALGAPVATTAATTTATTAGQTVGQQLLQKAGEQVIKQGVNAGVNALTNQGAQGAVDNQDAQAQQIAQLQQQLARMQAIQSQPVPQAPVTQPPYQLPGQVAVPNYTAGDIYNPFFD